jgi:thioredoxin reductase (NADPH)
LTNHSCRSIGNTPGRIISIEIVHLIINYNIVKNTLIFIIKIYIYLDRMHSKVLIIGSGPAGYTAAIYAARAMLSPTLVQGLQPGGQLTITTDVENYPGYGDVIQGPWLMEQMETQAKNVGTNIINDMIKSVDFEIDPLLQLVKMVIPIQQTQLLSQPVLRQGGLVWIVNKNFKGYGVSACATCDGFFFKDKEVVVVGGGNSAVEEALFLTSFASKVHLVHRRDTLRAEKILQDRLLNHAKINCIWNNQLDEIYGEDNPPNVQGCKT